MRVLGLAWVANHVKLFDSASKGQEEQQTSDVRDCGLVRLKEVKLVASDHAACIDNVLLHSDGMPEERRSRIKR